MPSEANALTELLPVRHDPIATLRCSQDLGTDFRQPYYDANRLHARVKPRPFIRLQIPRSTSS